jgi:hypothetical protein
VPARPCFPISVGKSGATKDIGQCSHNAHGRIKLRPNFSEIFAIVLAQLFFEIHFLSAPRKSLISRGACLFQREWPRVFSFVRAWPQQRKMGRKAPQRCARRGMAGENLTQNINHGAEIIM